MKRAIMSVTVVATLFAAAAPAAEVRTAIATAKARPGRPGDVLFAIVQPAQQLTLRAAATGRLEGFRLRPGDHVRRGERLGRLRGPTYAAALASAKAAEHVARRARVLRIASLRATEARYPVLSDRIALDHAKLQALAASAELARASARLAALQAAGIVSAPVAGTVTGVLRGDGERVAPGDALARVDPAGSLWLRAALYGRTAAIARVGMRGTFAPAGGGRSIAVRVTSLIPAAGGDAIGLGLIAIGSRPKWFSGEGGLLTLAAARRREPAIPTAALILSRGRWWVVEQIHGAFKAVPVQRDGSRGGWTWIASGLQSGDHVVTSGAYLIFHRAFAKTYANED